MRRCHPSRPFHAILLDDSSRLALNTKDALGIFERLNFAGIRLIAISQGIDSDNEQAHVLVTVHGMVDSLYVKELAKKTHHGLEGRWCGASIQAVAAMVTTLPPWTTRRRNNWLSMRMRQ